MVFIELVKKVDSLLIDPKAWESGEVSLFELFCQSVPESIGTYEFQSHAMKFSSYQRKFGVAMTPKMSYESGKDTSWAEIKWFLREVIDKEEKAE